MKYDNLKPPLEDEYPEEFRTVVAAFWPTLRRIEHQFTREADNEDE